MDFAVEIRSVWFFRYFLSIFRVRWIYFCGKWIETFVLFFFLCCSTTRQTFDHFVTRQRRRRSQCSLQSTIFRARPKSRRLFARQLLLLLLRLLFLFPRTTRTFLQTFLLGCSAEQQREREKKDLTRLLISERRRTGTGTWDRFVIYAIKSETKICKLLQFFFLSLFICDFIIELCLCRNTGSIWPEKIVKTFWTALNICATKDFSEISNFNCFFFFNYWKSWLSKK